MRTTMPDESGWYWLYVSEGELGEPEPLWMMVDVDVDTETVVVGRDGELVPFHEFTGDYAWHGPIRRPDEGTTVLPSLELHEEAAAENQAIRVEHWDFAHCDKAGSRGRVTVEDVVPPYVYRTVSDGQSIRLDKDGGN